MADKRVHHFGPAAAGAGGMEAVLATYGHLHLPGYQLVVSPTWRIDAPLWGAGLTATAARQLLADKPDIVHVHLSSGGSLVRKGALMRLARRQGLPVVASMHGSAFWDVLAQHPRVARAVLDPADVLCVLGPTSQYVVERRLQGKRLVVLPNPVTAPATTTSAAEQPPVALYAGVVCQRKGIDELLSAWSFVHAELPEARLLIAGRPDVAPRDVAGVRYLGEVPRGEVHRLLAGSRVAVLPSHREVQPMFALEAMARARPVVATEVGELPNMLRGAGTVVSAGLNRIPELSRGLLRYLADPEVAGRHGRVGRRRVDHEYSDDAVAKALTHLYDSL